MPSVTIRRPSAPIRARIELPRSKSVSNRALVAAALAGDLSGIDHLSEADDTRILHQLLRDRPRVMHCGLGGTTFRFLLAWAAVQEGSTHVVAGDAKLLERPHDDLIEALRKLGASVERADEGYRVKGARLQGGTITFDSPISSQYLSALMLVAPRMEEGLRIEWRGTQLSRPYVEMTAQVMRHFGAEVEVGETLIAVKPGRYTARPFDVPCDWSAAAFWYEIVALAEDAEVELVGLRGDGFQGDERVWIHMEEWVRTRDAHAGIWITSVSPSQRAEDPILSASADVTATPDLFQPLAFARAGLGVRASFKGLGTLRHKETDRLTAVQDALERMGCGIGRNGPWLMIEPPARGRLLINGDFSVHGDHRMAMALAPLALITGSITILDPDVVTKSYPRYWDDLRAAGFGVERA